MRRIQALALSLLLTAAPAAAQQTMNAETAPATEPTGASTTATTPAQAPLAVPQQDKRLDVDRDQARQTLKADEHRAQNPLSGHPWWWLVAAVAVGVIIAAVVTS